MKKNKNTIHQITVQSKDKGLRLDQFLGATNFVKNRSQALKLILENRVSLKNQNLKASYKLNEGDTLKVIIPFESKDKIVAYDIPLEVLYEDKDILVLNKPAGLVVHPAPGHKSDTLVNALFHHKKLLLGVKSSRPGVVHRLDKDTSGLLVLARTIKAEENLIDQFKNRKVKRIYWALSVQAPRSLDGTIKSYLCRHSIFRKKFVSVKVYKKGCKEAITHYKTIKTHKNGVAWLECQLDTGRTHQIRVHMSSLSCPVLGDKVYGKRLKTKSLQNLCKNLKGIALHAHSLSFTHPLSGKTMNFTCPWPPDLEDLIKKLNFERN